MKATWIAASLAASLVPVLAAADPAADKVLAAARADCESFEGRVFATAPNSVTEADLTGDGIPESIIDEGTFSCTSAASMYCGTGGCGLVVVVDGTPHDFLAKGWRIVEWGEDRILLIAEHGYECGGTNLRRCYEALVWSDGRFATVNPTRQE